MCAVSGDLTAAATIRDTAMQLFAERGAADVTIRQIAAAAGVSPSLVIHHYGSKDGLRTAIDVRATDLVERFLAGFAHQPQGGGTATSLAAVFTEYFAEQPALPAYLRRLFVDGGPAADSLFRALLDATVSGLASLEELHLVHPAVDDRVRAAFLLVNDLAVVHFREQIRAVLGTDPLAGPGMDRWTAQVMDIYDQGLFVTGGAP